MVRAGGRPRTARARRRCSRFARPDRQRRRRRQPLGLVPGCARRAPRARPRRGRSPWPCAVSARIGSPSSTRRSALARPTWRGSSHVPAPVSGTRPRCTKFQPKRGPGRWRCASRSATSSSTPMPTAAPSTAAMNGFGDRTIGHHHPCGSMSAHQSSWAGPISPGSARSVPAQNTPPAPVRTTARTSSSPRRLGDRGEQLPGRGPGRRRCGARAGRW